MENAIKSDDLIARACAYRGICEVYATIGEHKKALNNLSKSKEIFINADDSIGVGEVEILINKL